MSGRGTGRADAPGIGADDGATMSEADQDGVDRSRRKDVIGIAKGGGFLAGGSLFDFGSRFLIGLLLARLLGPTDYGLYQLAISAAALFSGISLLGLDDAMVRYVAVLSGRKDRPGVWGTIQIGLGIALPVSVMMGLVLYLAARPVAVGLFDEPALAPALRLMAVVVPVLTLSNVMLGVTRGFGRMDIAALGENVVQSVVRLVLLAGLALVGLELYPALVIFAISDVAAAITLGLLINRLFPLRPSAHEEVRRDTSRVFRFALPLWISGLLGQFQRNIAIFLLGSTESAAGAGLFSIVGHINHIGHAIYRAVIVAVKPLLAQLHDRGDREGLSHVYTTTTRWLVASNLPFFMAMVLYPEPVLAIFGDEYTAAAPALIVMAVAELVNAATGICGSLVDMTGHTRAKVANSVLNLLSLGAANAILVPRMGVLGAAYAYLIAIAVVNLARMLEVWVFERVAPSWRAYAKPMAAGGIAIAAGIALRRVFPVDSNLLPALAQGMAVVSVYAGVLALLGVEDEDREILRRITRKVSRRRRRPNP